MSDTLERIADAAHTLLCDREAVKTPAEAKLALLLHEYGHGYEISGKERCSCDLPADCDECATTDQIMTQIRSIANAKD